jgi:hypothetical protein
VAATLRFYRPLHGAWLANMAEEPQVELSILRDSAVEVPVRAKQACTIRLTF